MRLELQADCYAGIWLRSAVSATGPELLRGVSRELLVEDVAATGDDRSRQLEPQAYEHGTSAQRVRWFSRGYDAADLASCDTFSATSL